MDSNAFQLHLATVPAIDDILRDGARRALQAAIEREVEEYIQRNSAISMSMAIAWWSATGITRRGRFSRATGRSRCSSRG